jgi:hypothetical protein
VYITPRNYGEYATIDRTLTYNSTDVKSEFDKIVPDWGTPMRLAIYKSILNMTQSGRPKAVKAVIILSDGDYNYYGDPLARGTGRSTYNGPQYKSGGYWYDFNDLTTNYAYFSDLNATNQNMSNYAKNNGIKIYSIAYAGERSALRTLAEGTGGVYYDADASNIADVYTSIAGELKTEAGVNTQVDLHYGTIEVNQQTVANNALEYKYLYGVSTKNQSYWKNGTVFKGPNYYDQTADWGDKILSFNVGTVKLDQIWEVNYMLKVLKPGNINVFGPGSVVSFNNNASFIFMPKTFITAIPDMNTTGAINVTSNLKIDNMTIQNGTIRADITINPFSQSSEADIDIYISDEDSNTVQFLKTVHINPITNANVVIANIDVSTLQKDKTYRIWVDISNAAPGTNKIFGAKFTDPMGMARFTAGPPYFITLK